MKGILDFFRGMQRPLVVGGVTVVVLGLVAILVLRFGDSSMAEKAFDAVLIAFALITGYLFGERNAKKNNGQ
jgi:chromate transport protein ChrA